MKTAFISGHLDLTQAEFDEHYVPLINKAGDCKFLIGDARGADKMAQEYLRSIFKAYVGTIGEIDGKSCNVTVYHMFDSPRNNVYNYKTIGGFKSDNNRDTAMTFASDFDIAWVRPGREDSGTAKNLQRRKI